MDTLGLPLTEQAGDEKGNPQEGALVHVVGHGPATILRAEQSHGQGYEVCYPNGDTEIVDRTLILVHQPGNGSYSPTMSSPTGPRRLEYLGRAFDDKGRTIRTHSATFSLIATMVGGGVLSLPYAMSQCGLVLGTAVLVVSAVLSAWTLDMLVECARSTGRDTYELVGHAAYGEWCRKLTVLLVFSITWLAMVAYFVLLQDLLAPTAELVAPALFSALSQEGVRRFVVAAAAVMLSPMCYKGNLSALRFLCFASVSAVLLVGLVLGYRAAAAWGRDHQILVMNPDKTSRSVEMRTVLEMWPQSYTQALYVFPMFGVSFLCHFNALPTHHELQRPTRDRMRRVLGLCLGFTTLLYAFVSIAGYVWAGNCTCGNILLNFARDDGLITVGRVALGLVLMFNFPLIVQPCRNALFRLIIACGYVPETAADEAEAAAAREADPADVVMVESSSQSSGEISLELGVLSGGPSQDAATQPPAASPDEHPAAAAAAAAGEELLASPTKMRRAASKGSENSQVHAYMREDTRGMMRKGSTLSPIDTFPPKDETVQQSAAQPTILQRSVLTTMILSSSLLLSMFMKSILVVWSVLGSTVAFMIAFILPAAFWYRLVGPHSRVRRHFVGVMLVVFVILAIACSTLTALNLDAPPCPVPLARAVERNFSFPPSPITVPSV